MKPIDVSGVQRLRKQKIALAAEHEALLHKRRDIDLKIERNRRLYRQILGQLDAAAVLVEAQLESLQDQQPETD